MVTVCTICLTFNNSTFCPHSVLISVRFVWIWEQIAIISLYSINWLVGITETACVYCAVRTGSLYIIQDKIVSLEQNVFPQDFGFILTLFIREGQKRGKRQPSYKNNTDLILVRYPDLILFIPWTVTVTNSLHTPPTAHTIRKISQAICTNTLCYMFRPQFSIYIITQKQCCLRCTGALRTVLPFVSCPGPKWRGFC